MRKQDHNSKLEGSIGPQVAFGHCMIKEEPHMRMLTGSPLNNRHIVTLCKLAQQFYCRNTGTGCTAIGFLCTLELMMQVLTNKCKTEVRNR
jgi:hypothetical protein